MCNVHTSLRSVQYDLLNFLWEHSVRAAIIGRSSQEHQHTHTRARSFARAHEWIVHKTHSLISSIVFIQFLYIFFLLLLLFRPFESFWFGEPRNQSASSGSVPMCVWWRRIEKSTRINNICIYTWLYGMGIGFVRGTRTNTHSIFTLPFGIRCAREVHKTK